MSTAHAHALPHSPQAAARRRLRVLAEADPGAIARILQPFQTLNIVPLQLRVDRIGEHYLDLSIEVLTIDIAPESFVTLTAKIAQVPCVMTAVACDQG